MPSLTASPSLGGLVLRARLAHLIGSWRYTGDRRDDRLDLLRGFAALAMIIDHFGGQDSWLYLLSGGDRFFISAAEGFVFISGLVMGIVYAGVVARYGIRAAMAKAARRVGTLYALTVGLSLSFALLAILLNLPWAPQLPAGGFLAFAGDILTLQRATYLTDVLLLYTFVIAAAIPLLLLLRHGYGGWVLAGSWALWAAWQWWPTQLQIPWPIMDSHTFNFAAWQVLFLTGMVVGYNRQALEQRLAGWTARARRVVPGVALALAAGVVGGAVALYRWYGAHTSDAALGGLLGQLFGKSDLRLGRLLLFLCFFVGVYLLTTVAWTPIRRATGWLLLPLGRQALTVYTLHLFALALLTPLVPWLLGSGPTSQLDNTLVQAGAILLIWGILLAKGQTGRIKIGAARRAQAWRTLHLPAGRSRAFVPTVGRLMGIRSLQRGLAALLLVGLVLGTQAPTLAHALKAGLNTAVARLAAPPARAAQARTVVSPDVPTVAVSVESSNNDFAMLVSGTAVPGVIPTPPDPTLPSYVEKHTFQSTSLDRAMPYYIYLPPNYATATATRYPVLYMLHGMQGTYNEWLDYGLLGRARDMMVAGQIAPFVIVVPQGDQSYWVDHADGGPLWGNYVVDDLVHEVDSHFRTLAAPQSRAVGGLSMGGYGALTLAITHPDMFGVVGADSPSLHGQAGAPPFLGTGAVFNQHDPTYLYKTQAATARTLTIYMDVGQQDPWLPAIDAFHQMLTAQNIPHEWHLFPGDHGGEYWSTHVIDYLQFYSRTFTRAAQTTATPALPAAMVTPFPSSTPLATPTLTTESEPPPRGSGCPPSNAAPHRPAVTPDEGARRTCAVPLLWGAKIHDPGGANRRNFLQQG